LSPKGSAWSDAKYRILAFNWRCIRHPEAGGSEINLFEQARWWTRAGHDVTVVCADPGRAYAPWRDEMIDGIRVRRMGGRYTVYPLAAWYLLRHYREYDRILEVCNGVPFFSLLLAPRPGALLVHHVHDRQWFAELPPPLAALGWCVEHYLLPRLYHDRPVIAVSPTTRDALVRLGFSPEHIAIVYNGVSYAPDLDGAASHCGHRVVYVGRLKRYKRLERLVRAVVALRRDFPDVHLDIAGRGDARAELERLIERLGAQDYVTLYGFVDEETKRALLRRAAVFATPSMHEGWGLSVIEANAHGCPAVAYDVPGLCVSICHGQTGLLARDDDGFTNVLAEVLRDDALRVRLADGARMWAAQFDWQACATATLGVLDGCHGQVA
jgi:glycosyltransferase involved in cell wall biosynthesis